MAKCMKVAKVPNVKVAKIAKCIKVAEIAKCIKVAKIAKREQSSQNSLLRRMGKS